jgi:aryl-alcohol dehydrogenase-like predicted oxidoreductase
MKFRAVAGTDMSVSEVGFGCGGNAGLMVRGSVSEQVRVIGEATALGVNYFDTAPDYGDGIAEENLGRALKELGLRPWITTKVEIRAEDREDIAGHIVQSVESSMRRLLRDHVDVLQIHNGPSLTPPDQAPESYERLWLEDFFRPGGVLDGLSQVLAQGKARYAGFICRGNDREAVERLFDTGLFRLINVPYTLLNPTAGMAKPAGLRVERDYGDVLGLAQARGIGAAIFSPLAGGLLTDESVQGRPAHPHARQRPQADGPTRDQRRAARVRGVLAPGESLAPLAYRFILAHGGVSTVIGGFSDNHQVRELVCAADLGPLSQSRVAVMDGLWESNFGEPAA